MRAGTHLPSLQCRQATRNDAIRLSETVLAAAGYLVRDLGPIRSVLHDPLDLPRAKRKLIVACKERFEKWPEVGRAFGDPRLGTATAMWFHFLAGTSAFGTSWVATIPL